MNILIAGIGHITLSDLGFGPQVINKLQTLKLPENVELEDFSTSAVAALHRLTEKKYDRLILISALERGGPPGTIYREEPNVTLPDESEIQERMAESISGAISLENTLIVCLYYGTLPGDVIIIGAEPRATAPGLDLTTTLEEAVDSAIELVLKEIKAK